MTAGRSHAGGESDEAGVMVDLAETGSMV
jgi:hypothetical protein